MPSAKKATNATLKSRPENLSFARSLNITEAKFWQTNFAKRHTSKEPLLIIDKAVLASKSHEMPPEKLKDEIMDPNPQKGQTCMLSTECDTLRIDYGIKVLPLKENLYSCSDYNYRTAIEKKIDEYIATDGFLTLAKRYVNNIANARFLWRNRKGAETIETIVTIEKKEYPAFNSKDFDLDAFVEDNTTINEIAQQVADTFAGKQEYLNIYVTCFVKIGCGMEVYPSQEMTMDDKGKDKSKDQDKDKDKGKKLFKFEGSAGMHSQKIGNALRTIDTWYPEYATYEIPIPIENYGAARSLGLPLRSDTKSFYKLIDQLILKDEALPIEDLHYIMAVLIRGGLFSKAKDKKEK